MNVENIEFFIALIREKHFIFTETCEMFIG